MERPISTNALAQVQSAVVGGNKIAAIKIYREDTGSSLADAKDAVDKLEAELRAASPEKFAAPPRSKGCGGCMGVLVLLLLFVCIVLAVPRVKEWLKRRNESSMCGNHIVAITSAARFWADEHRRQLPPDLLTISNELNSPKILRCPADHARTALRSWTDFKETDSSYEVLSKNAGSGDKNAQWLRCRIHGHVGYADATVFDGKRRRTKSSW